MTSPGAVLIVDGKAEGRAIVARIVKEAGYPVLEAATGPEALALLSSLHPQIVLLDIDQPDTNGLDLARQIRLEATDVPVVLLSTAGDRDLVVKGMRTGAYDFLVKPVAPQAIKDVLKAALAQTDAPPLSVPAAGNGSGGAAGPVDIELLFRNSERMRAVEDIVRRAADTNATILLQGESGTGKEMVARAIHYISDRRDKPFLKVNCASLPGDLLESELFGHEKGAFTGAHRRKPGKFELAHRGTFLLDEIGEMPLGLQAKLLHVLQDGQFFRVGGSEVITSDARLIAATNRNLATVMATGMFREDLYYRLNVVAISIPPLRERREEIPVLVDYFMGRFCRQYNRDALKVSQATMRLLQDYHWPGNVRELENMIKRAVVLQTEALVQQEIALRSEKPWTPKAEGAPAPAAAPAPVPAPPPAPPAGPAADSDMGLKDIARRAAMAAEKAVIKEVLEKVRWNRAEAARLLKISYKAMLYKIRQVGLDDRPERGSGRK
ncbi:MAG TPA: sigma-54 dependent transcriptional regulator [Methylomirabilota bacterium]|nr:sigma-54 dependent transcriptional regulator [Methylomirabilota bacterium]